MDHVLDQANNIVQTEPGRNRETVLAVLDKGGSVEAFHLGAQLWTRVSGLRDPGSNEHLTAVSVGDEIYMFGNNNNNFKLRYTDANAIWTPLPKRRSTSDRVKPIGFGNAVYVFDDSSSTRVVAKFNVTTNVWSHVSDRHIPIVGFALAKVGDSIYCIGGRNKDYVLDIFRFELDSESWNDNPITSLTPRIYPSAVGFKENIYVIGGCPNNALQKVECFNTTLNAWSTLEKTLHPRQFFNSFVIGGKIYIIGGYDSENAPQHPQRVIEKYDPTMNQWEVLTTMDKDIYPSGTFTLRLPMN